MNHGIRVQRLREKLSEQGVEALYVTNLTNVRYLCGFTGSSGALLVGGESAWFLTDGRYTTQSKQQVEGAEIEIYSTPDAQASAIGKAVDAIGAARVGFEASTLTVKGRDQLEQWFSGVELTSTDGIVEDLRRVKEPAEIDKIAAAAEITDAGLAWALERVEVGHTEREIALDLEYHLRREGAEDVSFDIIVAAAERSALPHAQPTDREVEKGRYLLFDLGVRLDGYCSDLTRTVVMGPVDDRHREIYATVLEANEKALGQVSAGRAAKQVDEAARSVIAEAGYAEAFSHGLGHGVGLQVHEAPTLRSTSDDVLAEGEVVTIEPGVYLEDWGGVRVEDLVVVTADGARVLSAHPKELMVL